MRMVIVIALMITGVRRSRRASAFILGSFGVRGFAGATGQHPVARQGGRGQPGLPSASPLNPDQFVDPTNWANEISIGDLGRPKRDPLSAKLPAKTSDGNHGDGDNVQPRQPPTVE